MGSVADGTHSGYIKSSKRKYGVRHVKNQCKKQQEKEKNKSGARASKTAEKVSGKAIATVKWNKHKHTHTDIRVHIYVCKKSN